MSLIFQPIIAEENQKGKTALLVGPDIHDSKSILGGTVYFGPAKRKIKAYILVLSYTLLHLQKYS